MTSLVDPRPESERIGFLLRRDGFEATRMWVERTVGIYESALAEHSGYGTDPTYRPRLEKAIREFEEWLGSASEPLLQPADGLSPQRRLAARLLPAG